MGSERLIGAAQVCFSAECLFGHNKKAPWGVRQQFDTSRLQFASAGWYHHAWGIENEADAHVLADRINTGEFDDQS